jgi:hypothetical protein
MNVKGCRPLESLLAAFAAILLVLSLDCACCDKPPITGPPRPPVIVESRCELPPKPELPRPQAHRPGDGGIIAFTPEEANKLRERDAKLKQWIREVLARCGDTAVTEAGDAGSPVPKD